jgi:hypothetical protein
MAKPEDYPLFTQWYRTLDWMLSTVEHFPRKARFSLAARIADLSLDLGEMIVEAIYAGKERIYVLNRANLSLEKLRLLMRISHNRRYISTRQYAYAAKEIDTTGRMIGGWRKEVYEKVFIHDSYATRTGKGTHAAVRRAQKFLRLHCWYLKTDIDKFFDSVDHEVLLAVLKRKLKDKRLLRLLARIVRNTRTPGKGLPIGNLTSQFLANVYLDPLDHFLKDQMGAKAEIERFLARRLLLFLKPEATLIQRSKHGLGFLGMRIYPAFMRLIPANRKRSLKRMQRIMAAYENGEIEASCMVQRMGSTLAHLRHFCPNASMVWETGALQAARTG